MITLLDEELTKMNLAFELKPSEKIDEIGDVVVTWEDPGWLGFWDDVICSMRNILKRIRDEIVFLRAFNWEGFLQISNDFKRFQKIFDDSVWFWISKSLKDFVKLYLRQVWPDSKITPFHPYYRLFRMNLFWLIAEYKGLHIHFYLVQTYFQVLDFRMRDFQNTRVPSCIQGFSVWESQISPISRLNTVSYQVYSKTKLTESVLDR